MKGIYTLVGMKHWSAEAIVRGLPNGEPLLLVREPSNPADPHAIQVWARGAAVGYVGRGRAPGEKYKPGSENVALARHIDELTKAATFTRQMDPNGPIDVLTGKAMESDQAFRERIGRGFVLSAKLVAAQPPKIEVDE